MSAAVDDGSPPGPSFVHRTSDDVVVGEIGRRFGVYAPTARPLRARA